MKISKHRTNKWAANTCPFSKVIIEQEPLWIPHGPNHRGALLCLGASATNLAALPLLLLSDGRILGNTPLEKVN